MYHFGLLTRRALRIAREARQILTIPEPQSGEVPAHRRPAAENFGLQGFRTFGRYGSKRWGRLLGQQG